MVEERLMRAEVDEVAVEFVKDAGSRVMEDEQDLDVNLCIQTTSGY